MSITERIASREIDAHNLLTCQEIVCLFWNRNIYLHCSKQPITETSSLMDAFRTHLFLLNRSSERTKRQERNLGFCTSCVLNSMWLSFDMFRIQRIN